MYHVCDVIHVPSHYALLPTGLVASKWLLVVSQGSLHSIWKEVLGKSSDFRICWQSVGLSLPPQKHHGELYPLWCEELGSGILLGPSSAARYPTQSSPEFPLATHGSRSLSEPCVLRGLHFLSDFHPVIAPWLLQRTLPNLQTHYSRWKEKNGSILLGSEKQKQKQSLQRPFLGHILLKGTTQWPNLEIQLPQMS